MSLPDRLGRRVTAHREDKDILEDELSGSEDLSSGSNDDERHSEEDEEEREDEEMSDGTPPPEHNGNNDFKSSLSQISFGALAKAQQSLGSLKTGPKRKHGGDDEEEEDNLNTKSKKSKSNALNELRERIRKAKEEKASKVDTSKDEKASMKKQRDSRSSKHAPAVQSSKYAVTRRRVVVDGENVAQVKSRDPRFDSAVQSYSHNHRSAPTSASQPDATVAKNYAFLNDYRDAELKELNEQLRRTKNEDEKYRLKKVITSMNDRKRALEHRDREREVLSRHRKKERALIKEGKKEKAWFLKKADLKKEVLKEKYEGMGAKERQKGIERRRKKVASKEKKEMPRSRRVVEE
ncbi:rRNA biogenesis protein rrp36 [Arthroderma sp. PD_2]|nr:rRNA biogenesis protein rrp36 [Arthroderma sp. PD_2]